MCSGPGEAAYGELARRRRADRCRAHVAPSIAFAFDFDSEWDPAGDTVDEDDARDEQRCFAEDEVA